MRKLLILFFSVLLATSIHAQEVTKFLGIPVDGFKKDMISKLEAKGYTYNTYTEALEGEFNGEDVKIYPVTNNNKVWRIYLADENTRDESQIRLRFNRLCDQFSNNPRYISLADDDQKISEDEDISYEMGVHSKEYQAAFYQVFPEDSAYVVNYLIEQLRNVSPDNVPAEIKNNELYPELIQLFNENLTVESFREYINSKITNEEERQQWDEVRSMVIKALTSQLALNRQVWFTIDKRGSSYSILMYYDNIWNRANGEDL